MSVKTWISAIPHLNQAMSINTSTCSFLCHNMPSPMGSPLYAAFLHLNAPISMSFCYRGDLEEHPGDSAAISLRKSRWRHQCVYDTQPQYFPQHHKLSRIGQDNDQLKISHLIWKTRIGQGSDSIANLDPPIGSSRAFLFPSIFARPTNNFSHYIPVEHTSSMV